MSWRSDTQRDQQHWSFIHVVCSAAGSPEAEGAFSSPRKGLRQNVLLRLTRSVALTIHLLAFISTDIKRRAVSRQ